MSRGRSTMGFMGLIVLAAVFFLGIVIFGAAMSSANIESNYTGEEQTLVLYESQYAWWGGAAMLALVMSIGLALYYVWGG